MKDFMDKYNEMKKKKHETDNEDLFFFFNTNDFPVDHEYNNDCIPLPSSVAEEDSFLV